jgi:hypothetical protein
MYTEEPNFRLRHKPKVKQLIVMKRASKQIGITTFERKKFLDKIESSAGSSVLLKPTSVKNKPLFSRAMSIIDDYLNAGTKEERQKAHRRAKILYKQVYGIPYKNRIDK